MSRVWELEREVAAALKSERTWRLLANNAQERADRMEDALRGLLAAHRDTTMNANRYRKGLEDAEARVIRALSAPAAPKAPERGACERCGGTHSTDLCPLGPARGK